MWWIEISWKKVLLGYGFSSEFVQLVMSCMTSTHFTVRVNKERHGYFEDRRALRQEDPMPPCSLSK